MKIYPVIHHLNRPTTLHQAQLAIDAGADGVFLISHAGEDSALPVLAHDVHRLASGQRNSFEVGINLLNTPPLEAVEIAIKRRLHMVWLDRAGVSGEGAHSMAMDMAHMLNQQSATRLFASVAFKYQPEENQPVNAARNARMLGFIPTTSGPATGVAPDVEKIIGMSQVGSSTLAIASGMTIDNISRFAPYLSHVLVSTGVSVDDHHFDFEKLVIFISRARRAVQDREQTL